VDFAGVKEIVLAGAKQSAVQATFRDRFGNITDRLLPENYAVWYSNSTDATLRADEALTAQETLTQRVHPTTGVPYRGLYQASTTVAFPAEGLYSLAVAGITSTTGTTAFEVVPNVDTRVTVEGLRDTITAGEMLPAFTVRYFDASGNPTDNTVGRVMYNRAGGSSTATIAMMRSQEGVYAVSATRATLSGLYNLGVQGINKANMTGNKDFVVLPQIPISAVLTISTGALTSKGAAVSLTATFRDVYGNGANAPSEAVLSNQQILSSVATFSLRKTAVSGEYVTNAVVTQPGTYTITLSSQKPASDGGGTVFVPTTPGTNPSFNINPGLALRATFVNVPPVWGLNESLTPQNVYVRVTDTLGAVTNVWDGSARATGSNGGTTREVSFLQRDQNFSTHSGIFDLAPGTAFAPAGRYVLSLFHKETVDDAMGPRIIEIPFRSYAAGRTMDVAPAPVLTSVAPMTTVATAQAWTLTVNGTG
jgi:hypothetical protein